MPSSRSPTPLCVLCLDAHADTSALYTTFFETQGARAEPLTTAAAALARLACAPVPDLVIFDVVLADMSGLDFCAAIRARATPLRLMIVTAWPVSDADRTAYAAHGVEAIFQKPCAPDALWRALRPTRERARPS